MNAFLLTIPIIFGYSTPLILSALGGLYSERSGVVNVGLEGIMMVGAFASASVTYALESVTPAAPWIGLVVGLVAGVVFSLLHAVASVNFKADQVVSGTALNILAGGLTIFLCQIFFGQQRTPTFSRGLVKMDVPFLKDIPYLGQIFTNVYPTFFLALLLVLVSWFILYKTPFGLRLRSCGENPHAAASLGVSVYVMRYWGVLVSGACAGLSGGILVLTSDIQYTAFSVHGSGFIALACLIFGKWKPLGIVGAGLFFGASQVAALYANGIPFLRNAPRELFFMLPYVLTVLALILFSGKSVGPKASGEIYDQGKR